MRDDFLGQVESLTMGDVTEDLSLFMGAVIDARAFVKHVDAIERARTRPSVRVLAGGSYDDADGYFVRPTVLECSDPADEVFTTEYFGPILAVHVYPDDDFDGVLAQAADVAPYALTGAVIAHGPGRYRPGHRGAALLGGQLLHQRQADRRGRRPAALRRGPGQRHQRQGGLDLQPDPLGRRPGHQGAIRAPHRLPVPPHGIEIRAAPSSSHPVAVRLRRSWGRRSGGQ